MRRKRISENQSISYMYRNAMILLMVLFCTANSFAGDKVKLDKYGGYKGLQGKKTGFFHLEEINGRNWFVNPLGNVFYPVALSHLYSGDTDIACKNVYGGDKVKWIEESLKLYKEMGFNCSLGSVTSPERNINGYVDLEQTEDILRKKNVPFAVGVIILKHPWEFVDGETLPDIFEPSYKKLLESRAEAVCPKYKDDPLVMGYYYGFGAFNSAAIWVNHHLSLPAGSPGRETIVNFLSSRYNNDVSKFNHVYGLSLSKFSDLLEKDVLVYDKAFEMRNYPKVKKSLNKSQLADFESIISHMCVRLYKIAHDAIKKYDTNHLIFGSFVKEWALSPESWKAAAPYLDMIAPQHANRDISHYKAAEAAQLPVLMSDDYMGFYYPTRKTGGHGGVVSHNARAEVYKANLYRQLKDPLVLGVAYCTSLYDQGGIQCDSWKQHNGFYDLYGNPRKYLISEVTNFNKNIYKHALTPATPGDLDILDQVLYRTWEKYQLGDNGMWKDKK